MDYPVAFDSRRATVVGTPLQVGSAAASVWACATLRVPALLLLLAAYTSAGAVEPALLSNLEDGNEALLLPDPAAGLPTPTQGSLDLPVGARPHGLALRADEALLQDFAQPVVYRAPLSGAAATTINLAGRSNGNGTLAIEPLGRFALSVGESGSGVGEAVVIDLRSNPPQVSPIAGSLRVRSFVTAAIDFAPDRRAYVCHTTGVSVLSPPYASVDFTMVFPTVVQSPSMCRLSRDGARLFVTRVLSETVPSVNGVRTTSAPFSAASTFVDLPAPANVQGLGPMAISPDGLALIVGQQFLFPPSFTGIRARAFLLRAPFNASTVYQELVLPSSVTGINCTDAGLATDCPGFEHIEVSHDGSLAILTGNSNAEIAGPGDRVAAVFIRNPFVDATRSTQAVQIGVAPASLGRGVGGVRFLPDRLLSDRFESTP